MEGRNGLEFGRARFHVRVCGVGGAGGGGGMGRRFHVWVDGMTGYNGTVCVFLCGRWERGELGALKRQHGLVLQDGV